MKTISTGVHIDGKHHHMSPKNIMGKNQPPGLEVYANQALLYTDDFDACIKEMLICRQSYNFIVQYI